MRAFYVFLKVKTKQSKAKQSNAESGRESFFVTKIHDKQKKTHDKQKKRTTGCLGARRH